LFIYYLFVLHYILTAQTRLILEGNITQWNILLMLAVNSVKLFKV